ncbi:aldose epimerase family protein [Sphingobacterium tabacisoli]|uniref:Aldose 1-epimerase n=1 Tax=Sphingobacterium tabacisoli TaxID=2044855 RepID=A0ABW5L8E1_9SPHI|nr:aldose epimerase family protein [Sphingobacterium tabacisoli]
MNRKLVTVCLIAIALGYACSNSTHKAKDNSSDAVLSVPSFDGEIDGQVVRLYQIKNDKIQVSLTNYGARLVSLNVPDRVGEPVDVILGYDSAKEFKDNASNFYGAVVGRYGNRIGNATFTIDGTSYQLEKNDGQNSLHGGKNGLYDKVWEVKDTSSTSITFFYRSPDGEAGYSGNVDIQVTYSVNPEGGLLVDYQAETDKKTVLNLTSHGYFNLNGAGDSTILDHELWIDANSITEVNDNLIPTGQSLSVKGTAFDFTKSKLIGKDIDQADKQLRVGKGYDHNFQLNKSDGFKEVAKVYSPKTGIEMSVVTTEPGLQFYSGNFMTKDDAKGKGGKSYPFRSAFCLETQHYPDGPNHSSFPSTVVNPGDIYRTKTEYRFSVK